MQEALACFILSARNYQDRTAAVSYYTQMEMSQEPFKKKIFNDGWNIGKVCVEHFSLRVS